MTPTSVLRSFQTIIEMLEDRKIDTSQVNKTLIQQNVNKMGFEIQIPGVRIIYYLAPKYKWSELKKFFQDQDAEISNDVLHLLIVNDKISQSNMKTLNELNLTMQIFNIKELQFNITQHAMVPPHEVVTDPEMIKEILESYSLKSKFQLPAIMKNDPMSRYLGLKGGDIVKITRTSPTAGEYIVFRCCI